MTQTPLKGIFFFLAFCMLAVICDAMIRQMGLLGVPSGETLFLRSFFGALGLAPLVFYKRKWTLTKETAKIYFLRGFAGFLAMAIWYHVLPKVEFTSMMTIGFLAPVFITLLSVMFLGEKLTLSKGLALVGGFAGSMVVVNPFQQNWNMWIALAVCGTFFYAVSMLYLKKISIQHPGLTVSFFFSLVMTPFSLILAGPQSWVMLNAHQLMLLGVFVVVAVITQSILAKAFHHAELSVLMPYEYLQLILAVLISSFWFKDQVPVNTLLGGSIIFCSAAVLTGSFFKLDIKEVES